MKKLIILFTIIMTSNIYAQNINLDTIQLQENSNLFKIEKIDNEQKFDLVLLDLKMPRMGGINAMKII